MKCVLRLSCVVHGPIYGRFMGCTGFLSGYITGLHLYFELGLPVISLVDWSVWEGEGGGGESANVVCENDRCILMALKKTGNLLGF